MILEIVLCALLAVAIVLNALGVRAMRAKRKQLEAALENLPCPFCDVQEFEHAKECPVAKKRAVDSIVNYPNQIGPTGRGFLVPYAQCQYTEHKPETKLPEDKRILIWNDKENDFTKEFKTIFKEVWDEGLRTIPNPEPVSTSYKFKPGQWVRAVNGFFNVPSGGLLQIKEYAHEDYWMCYGISNGMFSVVTRELEPAFPRAGEWWQVVKPCKEFGWTGKPVPILAYDGLDLERFKTCGCVIEPVNFGRGNA